jgi:hypothetical protein
MLVDFIVIPFQQASYPAVVCVFTTCSALPGQNAFASAVVAPRGDYPATRKIAKGNAFRFFCRAGFGRTPRTPVKSERTALLKDEHPLAIRAAPGPISEVEGLASAV